MKSVNEKQIIDVIQLYNEVSTIDKIRLIEEKNVIYVDNNNQVTPKDFNSRMEMFDYIYERTLEVLTKKTNKLIKESKYEIIEKPYNSVLDVQELILLKGRKFIIEGDRKAISIKFLDNTQDTNSNSKVLKDYFDLLSKIKYKAQ